MAVLKNPLERAELSEAEKRRLIQNTYEVLSWGTTKSGGLGAFIKCPGEHLHTTHSGKRDCVVMLDDKVPTISCFHASCSEAVAAANHAFRSSVARAELGAPPTPWKARQTVALAKPDEPEAKIPVRLEELPILEDMTPEGERAEIFRLMFDDGQHVAIVPADPAGGVRSRGQTVRRPPFGEELPEFEMSPTGTFFRVNAVCENGSTDADVVAFRHVLLESDESPVEVQFAAFRASGLPITAVVHSGGKSLHAYVCVGAKDADEYRLRAKQAADAIERFEGMKVDRKCLNPGRLSRLAGCPRILFTDGKASAHTVQRLIATEMGAPDWKTWEEAEVLAGCGEKIDLTKLANFDPQNDETCVLGNRWLCRGGSLMLLGQSGVGKSTLNLQLAMAWCCEAGKDAEMQRALNCLHFGIKPKRALKILLVQAENDFGDLAEMYRSTAVFRLQSFRQQVEQNLTIIRNSTQTGGDFMRSYARLCAHFKPDIAIVDPLLSYIGADINDQEVCSGLTADFNRIGEQTGVITALVHHFGKPKSAANNTVSTDSDLAYAGLGSSVLTNWAREVLVLSRIKAGEDDPPTFRLDATKRRKRSGMIDENGQEASTICIAHSRNPKDTGYVFIQSAFPREDEEPKRRRK
jgi:RecA-family ATPase